uniref:ATP-dependent DNA helicase n=1 Tax=Ditylenchus dipsaci TaxID=166011 RepID=A0A915DGA1_9BILA
MRTDANQIQFADYVLSLGGGTKNDENDLIQIPDEIICNTNLEESVFGQAINTRNYDSLFNRAILAPLNVNVDKINAKVLHMLNRNPVEYASIDTAESNKTNSDDNIQMAEYLATINPPELPPHILKLTKHAIVMLIRNLSISRGLCNGTRLMIISMQKHVLECKILTGDKAGKTVFIPRSTITCENKYQFTLHRHQFPIKLAFAMTINKSQGQTFDFIGIDLMNRCFNHGQLYVAFHELNP